VTRAIRQGGFVVPETLEAMAEALEAAAAVLRRRAVEHRPDAPEVRTARTLAERARRIHRMLGERQEQMLPLLAQAGKHGVTSGDIARAVGYNHANTMITLNAMVKAGLLQKDESAVPYRFRLIPELLADTDTADGGPAGWLRPAVTERRGRIGGDGPAQLQRPTHALASDASRARVARYQLAMSVAAED